MTTRLVTETNLRLLTRKSLIPNMSFEQPGTAAAAPSSWSIGGSNTNLQRLCELSNAFVFPRGSILAGTMDQADGKWALKTRKDTGAANVYVHYTTAAGTVVLNKTWLLAMAIYIPGAVQPSIGLRIDTLSSGGVVQDTVNFNKASGWTLGAWNLLEETLTPTDPDGTKFQIYLINSGPDPEVVYFDYVHFGLLHEFAGKSHVFEVEEKPRISLNAGDGAYESVELAAPTTSFRFGHRRVFESAADETAWLDFLSEARHGRSFSIWREANRWQNVQDHYRHCVLSKPYRFAYEGGVSRYPMEVDAVAPLETKVQDLVAQ